MDKRDIEELLELSKDLDVLIVDDDVELLATYSSMAEKFFKTVYSASDGGEALQLHEPGKFDIIYTDINMPTMNGVELIREIKKYDPKQQFIVISASDDSNNLVELLRLHINSFILKPFMVSDFIQTTRDKVSIIIQNKLMEHQTQDLESALHKVTQEKNEQESMLIQQSKLAQTGEMIAMIAHQWRQPLSIISSVVATFKTRLELDYYADESDVKAKILKDLNESFDKIENSASFLSNTINDFRNFYRPDNAPKEFNLLQAIDVIIEMAIPTSINIDVEKNYCAKDQSRITTFEGELQQVIMNILNNAKDVFEERKIEKGRILLKVERAASAFLITITDNGGGIPDTIMENIFLAYFSTKDKKNGTGLGLNMTKTIIENHMKGTINVYNDNEIGGACFKIEVPIVLEGAL